MVVAVNWVVVDDDAPLCKSMIKQQKIQKHKQAHTKRDIRGGGDGTAGVRFSLSV